MASHNDKSTLNVSKTRFAVKANLAQRDELRFMMLTLSEGFAGTEAWGAATAANDKFTDRLWVSAEALSYKKCERCWHRWSDVGFVANFPRLCGRCVESVELNDKARLYA